MLMSGLMLTEWNFVMFFKKVHSWVLLNHLELKLQQHADGSRSGLSPVIWQSWETMGVDVSFDLGSSQSTEHLLLHSRKGTADEFTIYV